MTREQIKKVLDNSIFVKDKNGYYRFGSSYIHIADTIVDYEFYVQGFRTCSGYCRFDELWIDYFCIEGYEDTDEIFIHGLGNIDIAYINK